jgi:uncharacterized protein YtpQ (UPF0354 family)
MDSPETKTKPATEAQSLTDKEAQIREDEQFLSKNERDIDQILQLIDDGTDQTEADRLLAEAQEMVDAKKRGTVFHHHTKGNRKITLNHHTSNLIKLSNALELGLKTKRYGRDLHKELEANLEKRIEVLQRVVRRKL